MGLLDALKGIFSGKSQEEQAPASSQTAEAQPDMNQDQPAGQEAGGMGQATEENTMGGSEEENK